MGKLDFKRAQQAQNTRVKRFQQWMSEGGKANKIAQVPAVKSISPVPFLDLPLPNSPMPSKWQNTVFTQTSQDDGFDQIGVFEVDGSIKPWDANQHHFSNALRWSDAAKSEACLSTKDVLSSLFESGGQGLSSPWLYLTMVLFFTQVVMGNTLHETKNTDDAVLPSSLRMQ